MTSRERVLATPDRREGDMPGPGFYWMGEEEKKEVLDVLASGYLFRYGQFSDPAFKAKTFTLEQEFARQ